MLTQVNDKADAAHRTLSETVLRNVRVIAIDQEIVEGASVNNSAAGKVTHAVSLQLTPEQVNKTLLAKELGKLSLAIRAAVEERRTADTGTMSGCEVSPEIARAARSRKWPSRKTKLGARTPWSSAMGRSKMSARALQLRV